MASEVPATSTSLRDDLRGVGPGQVEGFFEGWPEPPTAEQFVRVLADSSHTVLAWEDDRVVGFITANSDGMNASIPLLEVLAGHRGRGIGSRLVERMLEHLEDHYGIDVVCDEELVPFYERFGLVPRRAMIRRNPGNAPSPTRRPVETPVLEVAGLLLRQARPDDDEALVEAIDDPDIHRWIEVIPHPYTVDDARDFHRMVQLGTEHETEHQWYITDAKTGAIMGAVGLHHRGAGMVEVGYWVRADVRGRGIASMAARAVSDWAFERFDDLARIEIRADVRNKASQRAALKAGFAPEGVHRARDADVDGGRRDMAWFVRLRDED